MYSLILMTAVAAGPDATAFGGRFSSCYGCCGGYYAASCYGGCYSACYGCCGGYYAASCHGCCGGFFGGLFAHKHSCCGGCYGGFGGCCGGYWPAYYAGCCGGCYGSAYYYGSCYGYGCGGCCGGCWGGPYIGGVVVTPSVPVITGPAVPAAPAAPAAPAPAEKTSQAAPALLNVELPAGATLYVDGQPTRGAGAVRKFHTPELPNGKAFFYELKAEVEVNGKVEVEEKRVVVRAGQTLSESFPRLIAAARGEPAPALAAR